MDSNKKIWLVASGDLRLSANQKCWSAQYEMEQKLIGAFNKMDCEVIRAHKFDDEKKHGFIDSQKMGIEVFKNIPKHAYVVVAESVWQYSHHVLAGLMSHEGPILTVANWDGQWPGLVGMLNLNGSLTKANIVYSTLWSKNFKDTFFLDSLKEWVEHGVVRHDCRHAKAVSLYKLPYHENEIARKFAQKFKENKNIMGVFDEGCMGMFNAIVPDDLIHKLGIFKERLSQSALYARMLTVNNTEAEKVLDWLIDRGMSFKWGEDGKEELTRHQTIDQCKMYIAAVRIAEEFGCDTIGIQYQQGLKDLTVASDLVEGLLNCTDRPPVYCEEGNELFKGSAIPHFNEVDECAGIDTLITYKLWKELGMIGDNTLHDIRWGEAYSFNGKQEFVWTFMISGAVPASHFKLGYDEAESWRQSPMYFKMGGGTLRGVSKEGWIVWSRLYVHNSMLYADIGVGKAVTLPKEETDRRWKATSEEWPIMHAVLEGVNREQMMARHKSNHIHVVYADNEEKAHSACRVKAAVFSYLGIETHFCGNVNV